MENVRTVVTDSGTPKDDIEKLGRKGINVYVV